jgi:predicted transporter
VQTVGILYPATNGPIDVSATRRRLATASLVGAGSFVLFGAVTGLLPNPIYIRQVPRTPLDYLFLVFTAGFLGVYTLQRTPDGRDDDGAATASAAIGFLAFGCPICNAALLALFSSSALMTYVDPLRPLLGAVSVALFGWLLYARSRRECAACAGSPSGSRAD